MKTKIKVKVRRLGDLARGHVAIDGLKLKDPHLLIEIAENITTLQEEIDKHVLIEEQIKKEVVEGHSNPIVTKSPQLKLTPEAEIRSRLIEVANQDIEIELHTIGAPRLFEGAPPTPGMLAALMPVLRGLDKVPNV